jgi:phosphatidylinositol alpha-1,6-mannosyltransferase
MPVADDDSERLRRILLATTGLYTGGGIASVSRCIARAFEEEQEQGRLERFDTLSLGDDPEGPRPSKQGVHEHAGGSQLRFAFRLWRSLRRSHSGLVLFDHAGLARAMQLPLPGLSEQPYAIFAHGGELEVVKGGLRRAAFEGAERILTNSEFTARYVRRHFPALVDRVHPVPLCIDPELIDEWKRDARHAPERREPAILIVGRLWSSERGKGHDTLIAAMPRIRERAPEAELWIVGKGDDAERLEAEARERGLEGVVRFLGGVSNRELGRLYRTASVYAMPSRQEGFGLVYAEAMWHGLPCVGSTRDAASEVISDGETGLLVPYGEVEPLASALVDLLSHADRTARMGAAAAEAARRRFTYERFRSDLLEALGLESVEESPAC